MMVRGNKRSEHYFERTINLFTGAQQLYILYTNIYPVILNCNLLLIIKLGAKISPAGDSVWGADIVVKVTPPTQRELALLEDRTILSFIQVCNYLCEVWKG